MAVYRVPTKSLFMHASRKPDLKMSLSNVPAKDPDPPFFWLDQPEIVKLDQQISCIESASL
jgi:hypothetical protein